MTLQVTRATQDRTLSNFVYKLLQQAFVHLRNAVHLAVGVKMVVVEPALVRSAVIAALRGPQYVKVAGEPPLTDGSPLTQLVLVRGAVGTYLLFVRLIVPGVDGALLFLSFR